MYIVFFSKRKRKNQTRFPSAQSHNPPPPPPKSSSSSSKPSAVRRVGSAAVRQLHHVFCQDRRVF